MKPYRNTIIDTVIWMRYSESKILLSNIDWILMNTLIRFRN
jgi:hypothetical protein